MHRRDLTMPSLQPPDIPAPGKAGADAHQLSALTPLRAPVFRMLWTVWLTANVCMWMSDVAAAWVMTSMTTSPLWVALVQTASTLPVFLLGLPSGALADILDRRRYFISTQIWVAAIGLMLSAAIASGAMTPLLLVALTFANGMGLAMRWPVFAALIPDLVPRSQLSAALALNGVAMNISRVAGPVVAGALIAGAGSAWVFLLNVILSVACAFAVTRWRYRPAPNPLGRERFVRAMRVGIQFVAQSASLKATLLRIFIFFFHSTALLALLPLVALGLGSGDARTFTYLLASMGAGAITAALYLPRMVRLLRPEAMVAGGTTLMGASTAVVALAPNMYVAVAGMLAAGAAWTSTANSLSVSAQLALPDWVRARGMAIYQMALMGGGSLGAAVWGQVAASSSVAAALVLSAAAGVIAMYLAYALVAARSREEDLTPSRELTAPAIDVPPGAGPVVVTIEYLIDPAHAQAFLDLMQESRRSRLRQGALSWELLADVAVPGRYVERIVDESWVEHLRRFDRITAADVALRERKLAFHTGDAPPLIARYIVQGMAAHRRA